MTPDRPYQVVYNGVLLDRVRLLMRRAERSGVRIRVRQALSEIERQLRTDPIAWGDPTHRLHRAQMTVFHRIFDEVHVVYAVHDTEKLVFPARFFPVLNHPLVSPSEEL